MVYIHTQKYQCCGCTQPIHTPRLSLYPSPGWTGTTKIQHGTVSSPFVWPLKRISNEIDSEDPLVSTGNSPNSQDSGADSRRVQSELHHVQQIAANKGAFAALRTDGSVVTWGDPEYGGDSSEVQDQLRPDGWFVPWPFCGKPKATTWILPFLWVVSTWILPFLWV